MPYCTEFSPYVGDEDRYMVTGMNRKLGEEPLECRKHSRFVADPLLPVRLNGVVDFLDGLVLAAWLGVVAIACWSRWATMVLGVGIAAGRASLEGRSGGGVGFRDRLRLGRGLGDRLCGAEAADADGWIEAAFAAKSILSKSRDQRERLSLLMVDLAQAIVHSCGSQFFAARANSAVPSAD